MQPGERPGGAGERGEGTGKAKRGGEARGEGEKDEKDGQR